MNTRWENCSITPSPVHPRAGVVHGPGMRAHCAHPDWVQATRTEFGRPSSSMRLRAWTATCTSVVRRSFVWGVSKTWGNLLACVSRADRPG